MKILVAVDVSHADKNAAPGSVGAANAAVKQKDLSTSGELDQLASTLTAMIDLQGAETTLLYVQEELPSYEAVLRTQGGEEINLERELENAARQQLEQIGEKFRAAGAQVKVDIAHGPGAYMIEQVARDIKADLTVVSAGSHAGEQFLIGSTSQYVVRHAPSSVLVLRAPKQAQAKKIEKILIAVDGSDACLQAVRKAVDKLNLDKATVKINLVHIVVLSPLVASFTPQSFITALEENLLMEGEVALANAKKLFAENGYKAIDIELGKGNAAAEIIKMQTKYGSDLIVIGSQGKSGVKHFLMGHVANRIVTHATAPTVVAR
ncbi:MAG: universal stress protein [Cyanobacteria bacterium REEB67]|nr:universal stress protein [Cyanobacteria bacterium REEB67]